MNKKENKKKTYFMKKKSTIITLIFVLIIATFGVNIILNHQAKEQFYSSYNNMNEDYKKVLLATGQEKQESFELMTNFENSLNEFETKYITKPIDDIKFKEDWKTSIESIKTNVEKAREHLNNNELHEAHLSLEEVRKEWQKVFTKNSISMLGVYLTDFHDKMEVAIELEENEYSTNNLQFQCNILDESLKTVENTQTDNGDDYNEKLTNLRNSVTIFCNTQNFENYNQEGATLKKTFISIYMIYG